MDVVMNRAEDRRKNGCKDGDMDMVGCKNAGNGSWREAPHHPAYLLARSRPREPWYLCTDTLW